MEITSTMGPIGFREFATHITTTGTINLAVNPNKVISLNHLHTSRKVGSCTTTQHTQTYFHRQAAKQIRALPN